MPSISRRTYSSGIAWKRGHIHYSHFHSSCSLFSVTLLMHKKHAVCCRMAASRSALRQNVLQELSSVCLAPKSIPVTSAAAVQVQQQTKGRIAIPAVHSSAARVSKILPHSPSIFLRSSSIRSTLRKCAIRCAVVVCRLVRLRRKAVRKQ